MLHQIQEQDIFKFVELEKDLVIKVHPIHLLDFLLMISTTQVRAESQPYLMLIK